MTTMIIVRYVHVNLDLYMDSRECIRKSLKNYVVLTRPQL